MLHLLNHCDFVLCTQDCLSKERTDDVPPVHLDSGAHCSLPVAPETGWELNDGMSSLLSLILKTRPSILSCFCMNCAWLISSYTALGVQKLFSLLALRTFASASEIKSQYFLILRVTRVKACTNHHGQQDMCL